MARPDVNDLMYRYFGGGVDAQYEFYADAAERGVSARDVLGAASDTSPLARFDRDRQAVQVFDDFLTDPIDRGTFAQTAPAGGGTVTNVANSPQGLLNLELTDGGAVGDRVTIEGRQHGDVGFRAMRPFVVEWSGWIPPTGGNQFTARFGLGARLADGSDVGAFLGFEYDSTRTDGIDLVLEPGISRDRHLGRFWSQAITPEFHRFTVVADPAEDRVEFMLDGEVVGDAYYPDLFANYLIFTPVASIVRPEGATGFAARAIQVDYSMLMIEVQR